MNDHPIINLDFSVKLKGRYKLKVVREDGTVRQETDWFDNLIVNQGLDQIGGWHPPYNSPYGAIYICSVCSLGTGTTTPLVTDTQLTSYGCASNAYGSGVWGGTTGYVAGPPAYWSCVFQYTFAAGVATGTWAEIGVGTWNNVGDTQPELFSHALITTSGGVPTTITVLSTESLIATYELDYYINLTTNSYSFTINTTTYTGNYLRANVATAPQLFLACTFGAFGNNQPYTYVYNGTVGTVLTSPSGTSSGGPNATSGTQTSSYVPGTYYNSFSSNYSISQGNLSGGISAIMVVHEAHGSWQFSVSPAIPKTSTYQLTLNYNISWAVYP